MSTPDQADREAGGKLMDDMWQRQQQKTFTAWVNSHLRKRNLHVDNVETDFCDGKNLIALLEIISDEQLPKPARGNMRIHRIQTVGTAFTFIKEKGIKLVSIGPEEIVDGNLKMILGMLWTLILRFEIQDISLEAMSAKDALLLWVQRKTKGYRGVNVENFHMSFKDGLAFNALIHKHRPELIDYDSLRKDDIRGNYNNCLEVADKHLDIPPMLDAEDMVQCIKPDERSIMTYVVAYYKAFASSNKNEVAAKKLATVLETNQEHERLIQEYETRASDLLEWINASVTRLNERPDLNSTQECQTKLEEFDGFQASEYPPKLEEKGDLEAHYSTLQTKLRLSGRPAYVPSEGKLISDIAAAWTGLEECQTAHKAWVLDELHRCQIAEHKAQRFDAKASAHETWTADKATALQTNDYDSANLAGVMALIKKHDAFQSDLNAHEARVQEVGILAQELEQLRYVNIEHVNDRYRAIYDNWSELGALTQARQEALAAAEAREQQLEELRVEFAKQSAPLANSLDIALEACSETYIANTEADVQELQAGLQQLQSDVATSYTESYEALMAISDRMAELGSTENPYAIYSREQVEALWGRLHAQLAAREQQLVQEADNQANREQIRQRFASSANAAYEWLSQKTDEYKAVVGDADFERMEDQLARLQQVEEEIGAYKTTFDELEAVNTESQAALIFDNVHTNYSIEMLRGLYQQCLHGVRRCINELQNQILTRDSKNLTEEQMKEYRESFKHFDKNGNNTLDRTEFRACLISLGYDIPQVPQEGDPDTEFNRVMAFVDPNGDGTVSFDEYMAFMAEEHADAETSEQLLEAFQILSAGKEYIMADDLRRDLSPELAEYCIANMSPYEGGPEGALDFQSFACALYGQSDL